MSGVQMRVAPQFSEIRIDQIPRTKEWSLVPLYKISLDADFSWQVSYDGHQLKITADEGSDQYIPVNSEQALIEARQLYIEKYQEGYRGPGQSSVGTLTAMKGYDYSQRSIKSWPVYVQPKLNGLRLLIKDMGRTAPSIRSWLNKDYSHLTHIQEEVTELMPYLPSYCTIDAEAYRHDLDFSTLISAVRTTKAVHPQLTTIECHMFDVAYEDPEGTPYEKRYELLVNAFNRLVDDRTRRGMSYPQYLRIVPCLPAMNHAEILIHHGNYVSEGYEGIMVKKISNGQPATSKIYQESLYKSGKCNHILKYKLFADEEGTILDIVPSDSGIIVEVEDRRGNIVKIKEFADLDVAELLRTADTVVGQSLTFRHKGLTSTGRPKYPVGIAIRDYE